MVKTVTYKEYVEDNNFMKGYANYQQKYAKQIRESDRVILNLVAPIVQCAANDQRPLKLIDIGCSTGNLLLYLRAEFPTLQLCGGDMVESILENNRRNPDLEGVDFRFVDLLTLDDDILYNIATVNAVLYLFSEDQFRKACVRLRRALLPGGTLVLFDFFHPYEQDLAILEKSATHNGGLMLHFRPMRFAETVLTECGFREVKFYPFEIPVDLEIPKDPADITSYTRKDAYGTRMLFRGTLFQPWCHCVARV